MRLTLSCATPTTVPRIIVSPAMADRIGSHSTRRGPSVDRNTRVNAANAAAFTPVMLALRFGMPVAQVLSQITRRIPRTHYLADILLDWVRQDPGPSLSVLEGLLQTRTCPPQSERKAIAVPTLVIGHPNDPLHPFSDAGMLVSELADGRLIDANSILEWRFNPSRLNDELASFLDEVWAESKVAAGR